MSETAKLALPLIAAAQAQKHVTHNEALAMLDTLVQLSVLDRDSSEPPGEPEEGDSYIVADGASGAWSGWEGRVVRFQDGAWISLSPRAGWLAWVLDEERLYRFDGTEWDAVAAGDVVGPVGTTENHLPQWDTQARMLKNGRPIGTGSAAAIPDRAAADARYARLAQPNDFYGRVSAPAFVTASENNGNNQASAVVNLAVGWSSASLFFVFIAGGTGVPQALLMINPTTAASGPSGVVLEAWANGGNLTIVTNTALDGTTGAPGDWTLSVNDDGTVQWENRLGGTRSAVLIALGGAP